MSTADRPASQIVVGVDGSKSSLDALRWAAAQADRTGAHVDAVIAWQLPTMYGDGYAIVAAVDWAGNAREVLDTAVSTALGDGSAKVSSSVVEGDAAAALLAAAATAELLVVGNRGHSTLTELLLGSVSQRVLAHAACPVVVVRHHPQAAAAPSAH